MKVLKSVFILFLVAVMAGCSKDDGPGPYVYNKENLLGTYSLIYSRSENVRTVNVDGFDVVTTTVSTGDTFSVTFTFESDNKVVRDGAYREVVVITQNNQTRESSSIVVWDNNEVNYSVQEGPKKLTIDGITYDVRGFSANGFQLVHSDTTVDANGDSDVYTEELRFTK